jgi:hypothetical protein
VHDAHVSQKHSPNKKMELVISELLSELFNKELYFKGHSLEPLDMYVITCMVPTISFD